jgi:hypothetical protein
VTELVSKQAETRGWRGARRVVVASEQAKPTLRTIDDTRRVILFNDPVDRAVTRHLPDDVGRLVQVLPL